MAPNSFQGPVRPMTGLRAADEAVDRIDGDRNHCRSRKGEEDACQRNSVTPLQVVAEQEPNGTPNSSRRNRDGRDRKRFAIDFWGGIWSKHGRFS